MSGTHCRCENPSKLSNTPLTSGDAKRLYARAGWQRVGEVPNDALMPDGRPCGTTFFYKHL